MPCPDDLEAIRQRLTPVLIFRILSQHAVALILKPHSLDLQLQSRVQIRPPDANASFKSQRRKRQQTKKKKKKKKGTKANEVCRLTEDLETAKQTIIPAPRECIKAYYDGSAVSCIGMCSRR
jgi:response regulator RpfG family c-di-GMP phosphodiesterase